MPRIMCLHLPYLSTDRLRRRDPQSLAESRRPLVLTRVVGGAQQVVTVCPWAQAQGVRAGMSLGEAQALVPELRAESARPADDRRLLERLAHWAIRFSPTVEPTEPNALLVDVTGCARLFGGEVNIVRQAVGALTRGGLTARAAIADTVGAAHAVAVFGQDAFTVVAPGQSAATLAPLPTAALRIESRTVEQLRQVGVRKIADLLTLPRADMAPRFGALLGQRLRQALGEEFEPLVGHHESVPPQARCHFETPLSHAPALKEVAKQLLEQLQQQAEEAALGLRRLDLTLFFEGWESRRLRVRLARPTRAWKHMLSLLHDKLAQVDLRAGVTAMVLRATETSAWRPGQPDLFDEQDPQNEEALGCFVDQLATRLGGDAIVRPELVDDHQPEFAFRWRPVTETGCEPRGMPPITNPVTRAASPGSPETSIDSIGTSQASVRVDPHPLRPVRLLKRPVPVRVIALAPDGPPTWFELNGRAQRVIRACGPERIETAWWRGPDVRRDYFRVLTEAGRHYWLFHTLDQGRWYVHGLFV
jgi:protein ImuB